MPEEQSHEFIRGLYGWITHTELASADPDATRDWCGEVLGWTFQPPFPTADEDHGRGMHRIGPHAEAARHGTGSGAILKW